MRLQKATLEDYKQISKYHYLKQPQFIKEIYKLTRYKEIVAILVLSTTTPRSRGRSTHFKRDFTCKYLNKNFIRISRLIVIPKYQHHNISQIILKKYLNISKYKNVEVITKVRNINVFNKIMLTYKYISCYNKRMVYAIFDFFKVSGIRNFYF